MQEVSALYRELMASPNHWFETRLEVGEPGVITTHDGAGIVFGRLSSYTTEKFRALVASGGPDAGFNESDLYEVKLTRKIFSNGVPAVGCCVSGEIEIRMRKNPADFPRMARIVPWVRVTDGEQASEWLQKGVYFIDTRESTNNSDNVIEEIHGYDPMLKTEQDFPSTSGLAWPARDWQVVEVIAGAIDVSVDPRTWEIITAHGHAQQGYQIPLPTMYTMREVLGYIGAMYAGNWVISDEGKLRLIGLNSLPPDTSYLVDENGYVITFLDPDEHYPDTASSEEGGFTETDWTNDVGTGGSSSGSGSSSSGSSSSGSSSSGSSSSGSSSDPGEEELDPVEGGGNTGSGEDPFYEGDDPGTGGSSGSGEEEFDPIDPEPGDPEVPDEPLIEDNFTLLGSRSVTSGNPDKVVRILV